MSTKIAFHYEMLQINPVYVNNKGEIQDTDSDIYQTELNYTLHDYQKEIT